MLGFYNRDFSAPEDRLYTLRDVVEGLGYDLGLVDYPIYDESDRARLNNAIYAHFEFRRIASETPAKFVFFLNRRMREHMPAINEVYRLLARDDFDVWASSQSMQEGTSTTVGRGTSKNTSSSDSTAVNSTTPQAYLTDPDSPKYMDALANTKGTGSTQGETGSSGEGTSTAKSKTLTDAPAYVLESLASGYLNPDLLVYNALEPLFLQVWDDYPD